MSYKPYMQYRLHWRNGSCSLCEEKERINTERKGHAAVLIKSFYIYPHHEASWPLIVPLKAGSVKDRKQKQSVSHLAMTFVRVTC